MFWFGIFFLTFCFSSKSFLLYLLSQLINFSFVILYNFSIKFLSSLNLIGFLYFFSFQKNFFKVYIFPLFILFNNRFFNRFFLVCISDNFKLVGRHKQALIPSSRRSFETASACEPEFLSKNHKIKTGIFVGINFDFIVQYSAFIGPIEIGHLSVDAQMLLQCRCLQGLFSFGGHLLQQQRLLASFLFAHHDVVLDFVAQIFVFDQLVVFPDSFIH